MMLKVDFHCHSIYSKDCLTRIENLAKLRRSKGLDLLAITDHGVIAGALRAQEKDPEGIIVGEEVKTQAGELLALFVKEQVPRGLPMLDAIQRLRQQDAFISVSHTFDHSRNGSWRLADLEEIAPLVDAIEVFNARCFTSVPNQQAQEFASRHGLAGTVGSDAHSASEIGRAVLILPDFHDARSLKQALEQAQPRCSLSSPWVHFSSQFATLAKQLHLVARY